MVWSGLVWTPRPDQTSCLHNNRSGRPVRPTRPPRMRLSGFHVTGHVYAQINTPVRNGVIVTCLVVMEPVGRNILFIQICCGDRSVCSNTLMFPLAIKCWVGSSLLPGRWWQHLNRVSSLILCLPEMLHR
ncbi:hypothetical protein HZ326_29964 [Fusarium oxysporum f. sp. albedinis]|nr:hypothetical protein HZ326_29964 [Fusarium oxysporum f. sp. albedinis]